MRATARACVWDPRKGEDFRLQQTPGEQGFSSVTKNLLVIQGTGIDWPRVSDRLDDALAARERAGFVLYRPWWPKLDQNIAEFRALFPGSYAPALEPVQLAALPIERGVSRRVLDARGTLGGGNAGVWLFGSCGELSLVEETLLVTRSQFDPMLFTFVGLSDVVDSGLALDEGDESTLFLRMTAESDASRDALVSSLRTDAGIATE